MQHISALIEPGNTGAIVKNLQDALGALLDHKKLDLGDEELRLLDDFREDQARSEFGEATRQMVFIYQKQYGLGDQLKGSVEEQTAAKINEMLKPLGLFEMMFVVKGVVLKHDGKRCAQMIVKAFDRDLRRSQLLGQTITNAEGYYEITYVPRNFNHAEKSKADLMVVVFDTDDRRVIASDIFFNAPHVQEINLTLTDEEGKSEWEQINECVFPLLKGQKEKKVSQSHLENNELYEDLQPEELAPADFDFIAKETGLEQSLLELWALSYVRSKEEDGIPSEVFFGWYRMDLPKDVKSLWIRTNEELSNTIKAAGTKKIIPFLGDELEKILARVDLVQMEFQLRSGKEGEPASLGDAIRTLPFELETKKQLSLVRVLQDNQNSKPFSEKLKENGFSARELWGVIRTLSLQTLTQNYLPMIRALQMKKPSEPTASLLDLVKLDSSHWLELVKKTGVPETIKGENVEQNQQAYANQLAHAVEQMLPSAWIAHRIKNNRFPIGEKVKTATLKFFAQNPGFQMGKTQTLSYFNNTEKVNLEGIERPEEVKNELLKIERIVSCAPRLELAGAILDKGFHSAFSIIQHGKESFVYKTTQGSAVSETQVAEAYEIAAERHTKSNVLVTEYIKAIRDTSIAIFKPRQASSSAAVSIGLTSSTATADNDLTATLSRLFGNLDYCNCEHCSSVYSPAAYMVDLLHVLSGGLLPSGRTPLDVLLERRPDIGEIDLTCDNTNISVPYVDLALEILESAIESRGLGLRVDPGKTNSMSDSNVQLNKGKMFDSLRQDISSWGFSITNEATISTLPSRYGKPRWAIRDKEQKIHLEAEIQYYKLLFWPQTYGKAETQTVPNIVLSNRYSPLKDAGFPWSLPFDIDQTEINAWLKQLSLSRSTLMEVFSGNQRFIDGHAAAEFLGFSESEANKLTKAITKLALDWGFSDSNPARVKDPIGGEDLDLSTVSSSVDKWVYALIHRPSILRHRAGISQRELMNLLETRFIQASVALPEPRIELVGDECDASKMQFSGLGVSTLNRIHLIVRLWRKLNWSIFDIDRALAAYAQISSPADPFVNHTLPEDFLLFLANVERLRQQTKLPAGAVLNWFTVNLDTYSYRDFSKGQVKIVPSLYERLFYDRSVSRPRDAAFELATGGSELIASPRPALVSRYLSLVAAALSVKPIDLEILLTLPSDDALTLSNLSRLSRYTSLARAFSLSIKDLLLAIDLTEIDPFASPNNTLDLASKLQLIKAAGFSLKELDYLLRHKSLEQNNLVFSSEKGSAVLTEIRQGLQKIIADTTQQIDEHGETTKKWLSFLQWDGQLIDTLLSRDYLGRGRIETTYDANHLPANISLPASITYDRPKRIISMIVVDRTEAIEKLTKILTRTTEAELKISIEALKNQVEANVTNPATTYSGTNFPMGVTQPLPTPTGINYDPATKKLFLTQKTTIKDLNDFIKLTKDTDLENAINSIIEQVRSAKGIATGISDRMLNFVQPEYTTPLETLAITIPSVWSGRFYYRPDSAVLVFVGFMTAEESTALKALDSKNNVYTQAINDLYNQSNSPVVSPIPGRSFIDLAVAEQLIFSIHTPQERYSEILSRLLPFVKEQLNFNLLVEKISTAFTWAPSFTERLLKQVKLPLPTTSANIMPVTEILLETSFVNSDVKVGITPSGFVNQFNALGLIYKTGVLITRLGIKPDQVDWVYDPAWLNLPDLNQLPLTPIANASFTEWVNLVLLMQLREKWPGGEAVFQQFHEILKRIQQLSWDDFLNEVAANVSWSPPTDFKLLIGTSGLNFTKKGNDFRQPERLMQLADCLSLLLQMGATSQMAIDWIQPSPTAPAALQARRLVWARYGQDAWYELARPIQNNFRQARRSALLDYMIFQEGVRDANDLYGKYLIDPEMGPCMMTTRILQATNSIQLFIHRCLMGLEPEVPASSIDKERWKWTKNYRVWEANRKVFFYPENWIEPELRDDKSPFFQELESELLQGDITSEKAENALSKYLAKVDEVSRLEVVGMYRDSSKEKREIKYSFGTHIVVEQYDEIKYGFETLYVFGRTQTKPYKYFFRSYHKLGFAPTEGYWTSWQAVDVDIEDADLLYPVVWKKKLHLFWLVFAEKADESDVTDKDKQGNPPEKYWDISLNWSVFEHEKWQARKMYHVDLINPIHPKQNIPTSVVPKSSFVLMGQDNESTIGHLLRVFNMGKIRELTQINLDGYGIDTGHDGNFTNINGGKASPVLEEVTQDYFMPVPDYSTPVASLLPNRQQSSIFDPPHLLKRFITLHQELNKDFKFRAPLLLPSKFEIQGPRTSPIDEPAHFILSDTQKRAFFGYPYWKTYDTNDPLVFFLSIERRIQFTTFYHPQTQQFQQILRESGISNFLRLESQTDTKAANVFSDLKPNVNVVPPETYPIMGVDFSTYGAYSQYNWELFFHLPFIVAVHLSKNQRFEEARQWFHYIFDPTDNSNGSQPARFWRFKPFNDKAGTTPIQQLARMLADPGNTSPEKKDFELQVQQWLSNPFKPHAVARFRSRAYMFSVVMKYLDNLIAWGDQLFRRDTRESLNEATQIYILAAQILGRKPENIPNRTMPKTQAFSDIKDQLDKLSNAQVAAENLISNSGGGIKSRNNNNQPMLTLLFCVPENPKIMDYYDIVEDRLFKLRNCMNIDGLERQLPLFDPPIDPAALVKAIAAGVDISTVLSDLNTPLPFYRFQVMSQKASELCAEVKAMGSALLSALEKRDGEKMALLRSKHEIGLLKQQRLVKEFQIEEAKMNIKSLVKGIEAAQTRLSYYVGLVSVLENLTIPTGPIEPMGKRLVSAAIETLGNVKDTVESLTGITDPIADSSFEMLKQTLTRTADALSPDVAPQGVDTNKTPMIPAEKKQLEELKLSHDLQQKAKDYQAFAQLMASIPDFTTGGQGAASSPVVEVSIGGTLLSKVAQLQASNVDYESNEHAYRANLHSILAGYQRRAGEWLHQANLAKIDIEQMAKQSLSAAIRLKIAETDLRNHDRQIENAEAIEEFMHSKFSNQELYDWMVSRLSETYFQNYQLAYDVAKRAERTYRFELGLQDADSNFIRFGYWDSLKKGLLAGENLFHDIKRMEVAYLEKNKREYELTKHISLQQLDPTALLRLKATGECEFTVREWLYDMDCPGHYMRRIKSVSLSVPCITGPYTGVNCTLILQKSSLRKEPNGDYPRNFLSDDPRFRDYFGSIQSIVTSNAQNDSGMFETNLRDERYLPFEGAGAESTWRLKMPSEIRQFNYNTITDVILHIRYTAREGGQLLRDGAVRNFHTSFNPNATGELYRLFSLPHDYPNEWHRFAKDPGASSMTIVLKKEHFPYFISGKNIAISKLELHTIVVNNLTSRTLERNEDVLTALSDEINTASANPSGVVLLEAEVEKSSEAVFMLVRYKVES